MSGPRDRVREPMDLSSEDCQTTPHHGLHVPSPEGRSILYLMSQTPKATPVIKWFLESDTSNTGYLDPLGKTGCSCSATLHVQASRVRQAPKDLDLCNHEQHGLDSAAEHAEIHGKKRPQEVLHRNYLDAKRHTFGRISTIRLWANSSEMAHVGH